MLSVLAGAHLACSAPGGGGDATSTGGLQSVGGIQVAAGGLAAAGGSAPSGGSPSNGGAPAGGQATGTGGAGGGSGGTGGSTSAFAYAYVRASLGSVCGVQCHAAEGSCGSRPPVLVDDDQLYSTLLTTVVSECGGRPLVAPGDVPGSALPMLLKHECDALSMPDGWLDNPTMGQAFQDGLEAWIAQGAAP